MVNEFEQEWIVTNGIGGYASGTVKGANTRSYHSLLCASMNPPTDRKLWVAKTEERIVVDNNIYNISTNQYPDVVYPKGEEFLLDFSVSPIPKWQFGAENWKIEKTICMQQHSNTTLLSYKNVGSSIISLEIFPLYQFADFHSAFHENDGTDFITEIGSDFLKTLPKSGSLSLYTKWTAGQFQEKRYWFRNIQLNVEEFRGLDSSCDYYHIGGLTVELQPNEEMVLSFSLEESILSANLSAIRNETINTLKPKGIFYDDLLASGNQFIVHRKSTDSASIIAGYHWFSDWGRDTMIAMRGLTIATGKQELSQSMLSTFLKSVNKGMIPNRFPDFSDDIVEYNTIDATLWLFIALYDYYNKFDDKEFISNHLDELKEIIDWHIKGTRYNIHVTDEGFLYGGADGVQLTWMDAIVGGVVITPRIGCPVEINALWYNALKIYEFFCKEVKIDFETDFQHLIGKLESNFKSYFTKEDGTLYDVIVPNVAADESFRCNQIYCVSLPFSVLDKEQEKIIFEAVQDKLFTTFGLRTLAADDPKFRGTYEGNQWGRDSAYHQGTVWPFLLEPYFEAFFKLYGTSENNKKEVVAQLEPIKDHFYNHEGIHCISEIFDGLHPQKGRGTIQQAWSVSGLIKLYTEYSLNEL